MNRFMHVISIFCKRFHIWSNRRTDRCEAAIQHQFIAIQPYKYSYGRNEFVENWWRTSRTMMLQHENLNYLWAMLLLLLLAVSV